MRTAPADPLAAAFTEHHAFVRERLRGLGVPSAELDDATQDVFEVLARRLTDVDPDRPIRAWLAGVTRKVARRHRERGRRAVLPIDEARLRAGVTSPEQRAADAQARAVLEQFMAGLDHDRWAVFVLAELEGLRGTEIAAELGLNLNTVYARLRSARAAFERTLRRHRARERRGHLAWALPLPGPRARRWWIPAGLASLGLAGSLALVRPSGCRGEDPSEPAQGQRTTARTEPAPSVEPARVTRPLPAWMLDANADHRAASGDSDAWRDAGWGFTEHHNRSGQRFVLSHERQVLLDGDRLRVTTTFTGDDSVAVDDVELGLRLDGFELVEGLDHEALTLAPGEVRAHSVSLRAVRDGPVAATFDVVAGPGVGSRELRFVAEPGGLRPCERDECGTRAAPPASPPPPPPGWGQPPPPPWD